jgi:hypothetical protein
MIEFDIPTAHLRLAGSISTPIDQLARRISRKFRILNHRLQMSMTANYHNNGVEAPAEGSTRNSCISLIQTPRRGPCRKHVSKGFRVVVKQLEESTARGGGTLEDILVDLIARSIYQGSPANDGNHPEWNIVAGRRSHEMLTYEWHVAAAI